MTHIVRLHHESKYAKLHEGATSLGKRVAIKAWKSTIRDNARLRDRLYMAATDAASHPHRHLLDYIDIDRQQGWIVSAWMNGSIGDRGLLSPDDAYAILQQSLSALVYLNESDRFHGNLKPNNLLLDANGDVCLSDGFMLSINSPGVIPSVGTPKYLAPEMTGTLSTTPGPGIDMYSLAFSLVELMAGPKFTESMIGINERTDDDDLVWLQWHGDLETHLPPTSELVPNCRDDLARVLDRMLVKEPHNRYRFGDQVLSDLKTFTNQATIAPTSSVGTQSVTPSPDNSGVATNQPVHPSTHKESSQQSQTPYAESASTKTPSQNSGTSKPSGSNQSNTSSAREYSVGDILDRPNEGIVITFASGIQAGKSIGLDCHAFDIGYTADCAVHVECESKESPEDTRLRVSQSSEGWSVQAIAGNSAFVNQTRILNSIALRSGDLIRLSWQGPDVQFYLQSGSPSIKQLAAEFLQPRSQQKARRKSGTPKSSRERNPTNSKAPSSPAAPVPPSSSDDWMRQTRVLSDAAPVSDGRQTMPIQPQSGLQAGGSAPHAPVRPVQSAPARPNAPSRPSAPAPSSTPAPSNTPAQSSNAPAAPQRPTDSKNSPAAPSQAAPLAHAFATSDVEPELNSGVIWTQPKTWDKATKDKALIWGAVIVAILTVIFFPTGSDTDETTSEDTTQSQSLDDIPAESADPIEAINEPNTTAEEE